MSNQQNAPVSDVLNRRASLPATGVTAYQVYPATVNVADPAGLTDGNVAMLSVDATGKLRSVITAAAGTTFPVVASPSVDGVGALGRVVAPGAGAAIATIVAGNLPAGLYDFEVRAVLDTGAPVAADINNMEFREGAGVVTSLQVLPVITAYSPSRKIRRLMDGATNVSVNATGAATAGVAYTAEIIATRVA
jgi:hypothetical protein